MIVRSGEIRTFRIFEFFNRIRLYETFEYQAASWSKPRWVVVRIAWHPGELFAKTGYIVTNLPFAPILLKNSCLIGCLFADSIPVLMGGFGDDGTEERSTGGAVL